MRSTIKGRSPVYLKVAKDGRLLEQRGDPSEYGIDMSAEAEPIASRIDFLGGMLPLENEPIYLRWVQMKPGIFTDVYMIPETEGDHILFFDVTPESEEKKTMQQRSNDLNLLRHRFAKSLDQFIRPKEPDPLVRKLLGLEKADFSRKDISVLWIGFSKSDSDWIKNSPDIVFQSLARGLSTVTQVITDAGGLLDGVYGDSVIGVFGALPISESACEQAIRTAFKALAVGLTPDKVESKGVITSLKAKAAISFGPILIGYYNLVHSRRLTVLGQPMDVAPELGRLAGPGEILIDEPTYLNSGGYQERFDRKQSINLNDSPNGSVYTLEPL